MEEVMVKRTKLYWYWVIIALLSFLLYTTYSHLTDTINSQEKEWRLRTDTLVKINETQYTKLVADTLTKKQLKKVIDSLELENIKKPKEVYITNVIVKEITKTVDSLVYIDGKLNIVDYYPNKEDYFVRYSLTDTISNFKFNPIQISLVVSEEKENLWKVDTKMPPYFEITNIKAISLERKNKNTHTPFYIGGGIQKQGQKTPYSVNAGVKLGRYLIIGGYNTESQGELKILYNL